MSYRRIPSIYDLAPPFGGLFTGTVRSAANATEPGLVTRIAKLGNIDQISGVAASHAYHGISGCGTGLTDEDALFLALVEGIERYSACIDDGVEQSLFATANELGAEALDLDEVAKCSDTEISDPKCPLAKPDKGTPIRWTRGVSLETGELKYIPSQMVYLVPSTELRKPYWLPISTGCAAHGSYLKAIISGILEAIERDAISIVWLQRCSIPRIDVDYISHELQPYWSCYEASSQDVEYLFFDATTDLAVPIVYCVQRADEDRQLSTLVTCSCNMDRSVAIGKTLRDMAALRVGLRNPITVPDDWREFHGLFQGAAFMARAEQRPVFDFLLKTGRHVALSDMKMLSCGTEEEQLFFLLKALQKNEMHAYAVDLTTDEALRCGFRVVRVVIPQLQPLSFSYRARYLGHKRLYEAPVQMGYHSYCEDELNNWPEPFA